MRIAGRELKEPKKKLLVIPRDEGGIPFHFIAITNSDDYEKINPKPLPPRVFKQALGQTIEDVEDKTYKAKLMKWSTDKTNWVFLKSIEPSNIEWDTVNLSDASTYENWREDFKNSGFNQQEINAIFNAFAETNFLTDDMLTEARASFLAFQAAQALTELELSQNIEQESSLSGTPAEDSESDHPKLQIGGTPAP